MAATATHSHLELLHPQRRVVVYQALAATARPAHLPRCQRALRRQVLQAARDRARRNAGGLRHRGNAAVAGGTRFRRRQQAAGSLVEVRCYHPEALTDLLVVDHPATLQPPKPRVFWADGLTSLCGRAVVCKEMDDSLGCEPPREIAHGPGDIPDLAVLCR